LQFDGSTGSEEARLGQLRVRPFMGGYGYYQRRGRTALSATLVPMVPLKLQVMSAAADLALSLGQSSTADTL
jgi:hypothetical protein